MQERWYDPRLDWHPGLAEVRTTTIREAQNSDFYTLKSRLHVNHKTLVKWLRFFGWTVRVAVRNERNVVGIVVAEHGDDKTQVLRWWKSPRFEDPKFMRRLFALAAMEQPELPTQIEVRKEDKETESTIRHLGWSLGGITDETNLFVAEPWKPFAVEPEVNQ